MIRAILAALLAAWPAAGQTTLTIGFAAEATTLDPIKYSAGADSYGMSQMFEQLLRPLPPNWKPGAWLAESWSIGGSAERPTINVAFPPWAAGDLASDAGNWLK